MFLKRASDPTSRKFTLTGYLNSCEAEANTWMICRLSSWLTVDGNTSVAHNGAA